MLYPFHPKKCLGYQSIYQARAEACWHYVLGVLVYLIEQGEKGYLISAEVFGKGVDMWLRSQGDWVERVDS